MIETKKINLRTFSPMHIKGKDYKYGEGFIRRNDNSAYVLDIGKLFNFIHNEMQKDELLYKYNNLIENAILLNKIKEFDNEKFLSDEGIYNYLTNKTLEAGLIHYGAFSSIVSLTKENEFIKDGKNRAYIPGSSIKGGIRTALFYSGIQYYKSKKGGNNVTDKINSILANINVLLENLSLNLKKCTDEREEQRLKKDFLKELEFLVFRPNEPMKTNDDLLRSIKVKDSFVLNGLSKQELVITSAEPSHDSVISTMTQEMGRIVFIRDIPFVEINDIIKNVSKKMTKERRDILIKNEGKIVLVKEFDKESVVV
ncbi:MAG: type III-A CRISPR-associated RAMP protein Csm5, partial [Ignavibacteriaceae bacterium]